MYDLSLVHTDIKDVPIEWVYRHFYKEISKVRQINRSEINQRFDGRIIKVRSLESNDSNPSLCFYYKDGKYKWYDHSQGVGGDSIQFVAYHTSKYRGVAGQIIIDAYNHFIQNDGKFMSPCDIKVKINKFITEPKRWSVESLMYWRQYKITQSILDKFNVKPLNTYKIQQFEGEKQVNELSFVGDYYAFICNSSGVYQIYRPNDREGVKYLSVDPTYMIGEDQLQFKHPTCIIVSGLKDLMAMYSLGLDIEYVAGPSENIVIPHEKMDFLKSRYRHVITMMDNDKAGFLSMMRYEKLYSLPKVVIKLEKDHADNVRKHKSEFLMTYYPFQINKILNKWTM